MKRDFQTTKTVTTLCTPSAAWGSMEGSSTRRLEVLSRHLGGRNSSTDAGILTRQATAATAVRTLPKFDPYIMETYLDDLRELKRQVHDLFKYKPELLPGPELSKGAAPHHHRHSPTRLPVLLSAVAFASPLWVSSAWGRQSHRQPVGECATLCQAHSVCRLPACSVGPAPAAGLTCRV